MSILPLSNGDHAVQAMPLIKGKINITSGTFEEISLIHCVADGTITINWKDLTTTDLFCVEGNNFSFIDPTSITISTGTFHLA